MTHSARWLAFFGLTGLLLGTIRGQSVLALLSLCVLLWILMEWIAFQYWVRFEFPKTKFERTLNGRSDSNGVLWATRKVHVVVRASNPSGLRAVLIVRDVVPEILSLLPINPASVSSSSQAKKRLRGVEWLWEKLKGIYDPEPKGAREKNEWRVTSRRKEAVFRYDAQVRAAGVLVLPGIRVTLQDRGGLFQHARFIELKQTYRILPHYSEAGELRPTIKRSNTLPQHGVHRLQRSGMGSELLELREYIAGDPPKSIAWKVSARRDKLMTRQYESEVPVRVQLLIDGSIQTRIGGYGGRLLDQINYVAASVAKAAIAIGDPVGGILVDERGIKRLPSYSGERGLHQFLRSLSEFSELPALAPTRLTKRAMDLAMQVCHERFPELLDSRFNQIPFSFSAARRERFQLSAVLAECFELSLRQQVEIMHDDLKMATHLQAFLSQAGLSWMEPVSNTAASESASSSQRLALLSQAMAKAISHARDNEVFVVLADLLESAPYIKQLEPVLKLAIAKHHRVAFVCPTPTFKRPVSSLIEPASEQLQDLLLAAEEARVRDVANPMKRELLRLGISVSFSGEESAIRMILAEMDGVRGGRQHLQGVR